MRDFEIYELPNGIRVIHKQVTNTKIAHCGFVLDIGSRDEKPHQQGLAHFWEHMAFKGTQKRKAFHILTRLDAVGGDLNAYTTKEKICFHASVLESHFEKALELLTDITFNSVFPEKEIKKEKGVILEEMSMYLDDPADAILDHFDEVVFGDHPLGKNILGTTASVNSFSRQNFLEFIHENLNNERLIFSSVSTLPISKVKDLADKYLKDIPVYSAQPHRLPFAQYKPNILQVSRPITQAHCSIGREAYSLHDEKRFPFFLLNNLLGGPGMNSRLNLALREKHGLAYTVEASYNAFVDTGMFSIYFGTERNALEKATNLVLKELAKLRSAPLGTLQLHRAKQQIMGQLAMAEESNIGLMLMMGKSILDINKIEALNDIFQSINEISAERLCDIANEMFQEKDLSILSYLPENDD